MDPNNSGSFGAALPTGGDPIQEAMARRATGQAGVTDQSSMSQTPMPGQPQGAAPQVSAPQTSAPQPLPGESPATVDRNLILKALDSQLKRFDKQEEMKLGGGLG